MSRWHWAVRLGLLLLLTSCGTEKTDETAPSPISASPTTINAPSPSISSPTCAAGEHGGRIRDDRVLVFFDCETDSRLHAFSRPVPASASVEEKLTAAVTAYFVGPAIDEGDGLYAFAPTGTLNSATIQGDRAVIDVDMTGVASTTTAQSTTIWRHLRALAFQFTEVNSMEPRYNGSCDRFGGVVEAGECLVQHRRGNPTRG